MEQLEQIQNDISELKARNAKVEADKAWEISWARRILIAGLTYIVIVIFFITSEFPRPWLSALVPTAGFLLSTLTVPVFKALWLKRRNK